VLLLDVNTALKDGGRGTAGGSGRRLSTALAIVEMAFAMVLLAGAGVMTHSFITLYTADIGVDTSNLLTALLILPPDRYPDARAQVSFYDRLTPRLETIPGVESVALTSNLPTSGTRRVPYEVAGAPPVDERRRPTLALLTISSSYFQTMGTPLVSGREFVDADAASGLPVAIVNERLASIEWPGENPIGKRLRVLEGTASGAWLTVVGVAPNIMQADLTRQSFEPVVYVSHRAASAGTMWILARSLIPFASVGQAFRREVHAVDPALTIWLGPMPLSERLAGSYWNSGVYTVLFLAFAAVALLLAATGLFAVIAQSVSQRTQEIGVRIAVGGTARDIVYLVLKQGLLPSTVGLMIGLAASLAMTPLLKSVLVQVSPADPVTLAVVPVVLMTAAMLGWLIPVRRALRIDPVVALRHE
jgi:putative ABC transport system permease protein